MKREVHAIGLACRDRRTPWYAKAIAACVVAYALSPLDLIPDPIPVLGHLDDLVLLPLGVLLVRSLIPPAVLADCRRLAALSAQQVHPHSRMVAAVVVAAWLAGALGAGWGLWRLLG